MITIKLRPRDQWLLLLHDGHPSYGTSNDVYSDLWTCICRVGSFAGAHRTAQRVTARLTYQEADNDPEGWLFREGWGEWWSGEADVWVRCRMTKVIGLELGGERCMKRKAPGPVS